MHTSLKFAQLSGSYVVVQDFPSIIGEEETLQRELEELQSLQSLTNILSNGIELSKKEIWITHQVFSWLGTINLSANFSKSDNLLSKNRYHRTAGTHFVRADLHWLILFCPFCSESLFALAYYVLDNFVLWHILYWTSFYISLLCTRQFCTMANFVLRPNLN